MTDIKRLYREMHELFAVHSKVQQALPDILPLLTKERLSAIAGSVDLAGRAKMSKEELVSALPASIADETYLDEVLRAASDNEFRLFEAFSREPYVQDDEAAPGDFRYFWDRGLLFLFQHEDKIYFVIPKEVRDWRDQLDEENLRRKRERHQQVLLYIRSALRLYGACQPDVVVEIFNRRHAKPLDHAELREIADRQMQRSQAFHWLGSYLADETLEDGRELEALLRRQAGKPRYMPDDEDFLQYSDPYDYVKSPQLDLLEAFILRHLTDNAVLAENLVDEIDYLCSQEATMQQIMNAVNRVDHIAFDSTESARRFMYLVTDVYNHSRQWANNGHTPAELSALTGRTDHLLSVPGSSGASTPKKVGRNDPCPCGSGLKYKKCCGKATS